MKNLFLFLLLLLCTVVISCQKEITLTLPLTDSSGAGTVPPSTNGDLLVKVYSKAATGMDSNVTYYTYNGAKKLIGRHIMIHAYGASNDSWYWYERNAAGLIVRSKQYVVYSSSPIPADTVITTHYYSTGTNPTLLYSIRTTDFLGLTISDSLTYIYNSAGKIIKTEGYQTSFLSATPNLSSRQVFTYDASGNASKVEVYSISGGVATLSNTQNLSYDNKSQPVNFSEAEAIIITEMPAPKHNPTQTLLAYPAAPGNNVTIKLTYTYNSANKPATSVITTQALGTTTTVNFTIYYQ